MKHPAVTRDARILAIGTVAILCVAAAYYVYAVSLSTTAPQSADWRVVENYVPVTNSTLKTYSDLNHNNSLLYYRDVVNPYRQCLLAAHNASVNLGFCVSETTRIGHQEHPAANAHLLNEGFWASCLVDCSKPYNFTYFDPTTRKNTTVSLSGILYLKDPTTVFTNTGHDFLEYIWTGSCPAAITCTVGDVQKWYNLEISTSSTTPAVTDTGCGGGAGSGQITTGGLADTSSTTVTVPNAASGTVTFTIAHTWTAAETDTSIQDLCLNTEVHTGSNIILGISGTFGPDTLVSGNTFAGTVSIAAT